MLPFGINELPHFQGGRSVVLLFDPGSPFRTTIGAIHPYFAQFLAGAAHVLKDFPRAGLVGKGGSCYNNSKQESSCVYSYMAFASLDFLAGVKPSFCSTHLGGLH